jgi:hypothetical protein
MTTCSMGFPADAGGLTLASMAPLSRQRRQDGPPASCGGGRRAVPTPTARGSTPVHEHLLSLQQTVGNAAVHALLLQGPAHPGAPRVALQRQVLPTPDALRADLDVRKLPAVRDAVATLFHRLHRAGRLRDPNGERFDSVETAMRLVFVPARSPQHLPVFNRDIYSGVYERSLAKSNTDAVEVKPQPIQEEHWRALQPIVAQAASDARACAGRKDLIDAVLGPLEDTARVAGVYEQIATRLSGFAKENFLVDYSNSSDFTGAAGATRAHSGVIQLSGSLVVDAGSKNAVVREVLIHEAAHETDASIVDLGYAHSAGFDRMLVKDKLANADHYAEVASRILGISRYGTAVFRPQSGVLAGTALRDLLIKNIKPANDGLERLWNLSLDMVEMTLRLVPGVEPLSGEPMKGKETGPDLQQKRDLAGRISWAYGLGGSFVVTGVDRSLIESAAMVFRRAKGALARLATTQDPDTLERYAGSTDAFDLASRALRAVGGLHSDENESQKRHWAVAELHQYVRKTPAYP